MPWYINCFGLEILDLGYPSLLPKYGSREDQQLNWFTPDLCNPDDSVEDDGAFHIFTPDAVFEGYSFPYLVHVNAPGVKFLNCRFKGVENSPPGEALLRISIDEYTSKRTVLDHCSLIPQFPATDIDGIRGSNFTLENCEIAQVVDAVSIYGPPNTYQPVRAGNVTVRHCLIHELTWPDGWLDRVHGAGNGVWIAGGSNILIENNLFENHMTTAAVLVNQSLSDVRRLTIHDNVFNMSGGYGVRIEDELGSGPIQGLGITDNIFYKAGVFNGITISARTLDSDDTVLTNNFWRTGLTDRPLVTRSA